MEILRVQLLGGIRLSLGSRLISSELSRKGQALLCYLAVTHRPHSRDVLAGLLWSDFPEHRARANLRDTLSDLNRVLPQHLAIDQQKIALAVDPGRSWVDTAVFEYNIEQVHQALRKNPAPAMLSPELLNELEEVVDLYQGEFLAGFYVRRAVVFEEWFIGYRENLRQSAVEALQILANNYTRGGNYPAALTYAHHLLQLDPWREEGQRQLMRLLTLCGQQSAALKQYETCRQILMEELGLKPAAETTSLYEAIRCGELQPPSLVRKRGFHLPTDVTPFIGREEELQRLDKLIADPDIRLVNIIGPGGIGKTRLALAAARRLVNRFQFGIAFVSLATLDSPRQLATAIAAELQLPLGKNFSSRGKLLDYLQDKSLLLILDNFEHLLEDKALLTEILARALQLTILVTSREALNLRQEQLFPIGGLRLPDTETRSGVLEADATRLFLQSASRLQPDFTLYEADLLPLNHICRLVEGMPLAIELAAGWANTVSLTHIADQLTLGQSFLHAADSFTPDRHASMETVFESSWQQLSEEERQDFKSLAVFKGGITAGAAQHICGLSFLSLSRLVSKSLLQYERARDRYQMHELLRQFAALKLALSENEAMAVRANHITYYCQLLNAKEHELKGAGQDAALAEIDADLGNIRKAWRGASESGLVDLIAGAVDGLALYYRYRFQPDEFISFCHIAADNLHKLATAKEFSLPARCVLAKIEAMQAAPYVHATIGSDYLASKESRIVLEKSRREIQALAHTGGDVRREQAFIELRLGALMLNIELDRSIPLLEGSLALYKELDDPWGQSEALHYLSSAQLHQQGYQVAKPMWENSLALKRQEGDIRGLADSLAMLGIRAASFNETVDTLIYAQECFDTYKLINDEASEAEAHWNYGVLMAWAGQYAKSEASLTHAEILYDELGLKPPALILGNALAMRGKYDAVVDYVYHYMAKAGETTYKANEARANNWLAYTALAHKEYTQAYILSRESIANYEACGLKAYAGFVYGLLALSVRGLGDREKPWQYQEKGLRIQMAGSQLGPLGIWLCAPITAVLLADAGHLEEAVAAYTFATNHPMIANSVWFDEVVGEEIRTAEAHLSPESVVKAHRRGRESDPWRMVEGLLELVTKITSKTR